MAASPLSEHTPEWAAPICIIKINNNEISMQIIALLRQNTSRKIQKKGSWEESLTNEPVFILPKTRWIKGRRKRIARFRVAAPGIRIQVGCPVRSRREQAGLAVLGGFSRDSGSPDKQPFSCSDRLGTVHLPTGVPGRGVYASLAAQRSAKDKNSRQRDRSIPRAPFSKPVDGG